MKPLLKLFSPRSTIMAAVILLFAVSSPLLAEEQSLNLLEEFGFGNQDDILDPEEAFQLDTEADAGQFVARWNIAEGHYLYREKMQILVDDPALKPGALILPRGDIKLDPVFNKELEVYHHSAQVTLPYQYTQDGARQADFKVKYQGCSEISGICYPPQTKTISVRLPFIGTANAASGALATAANQATANTSNGGFVSEQDKFAQTLNNRMASGNTWLTLAAFFGAGLLLAFTPCVFPMIPILCGIIVGQSVGEGADKKHCSTRKAFGLSLVYVLAMALTYTVVGILVGLSGENIQAWFQNPWIIGSFAAIFVLLSLSMFGFYDLQMPASVQGKLTQISNSQHGGNLIGVAIMGFLSALIVGPCVTAPLVGALIYIAETGDAAMGGMALFALSMGMGAPLLVIGASAGKLLPKAGPWMDAVKAFFGVLLLGLGIWLLERVAPAALTMSLWASLLIVSSIYMGAIDTLPAGASGWHKLWKGVGLLLLVYGVILVIGVATGNRNVFQPLEGLSASSAGHMQKTTHLTFRPIKGVEGLNNALTEARALGKPVMLDFYADWCISCKEMETFTFADPGVQNTLKNVMLLQADVTPNDDKDKALYKHFGIIGPPSIMFFDTGGQELRNYRVVGYMPPEKFNQHVQRALN